MADEFKTMGLDTMHSFAMGIKNGDPDALDRVIALSRVANECVLLIKAIHPKKGEWELALNAITRGLQDVA